jgi:hypothetical protein
VQLRKLLPILQLLFGPATVPGQTTTATDTTRTLVGIPISQTQCRPRSCLKAARIPGGRNSH